MNALSGDRHAHGQFLFWRDAVYMAASFFRRFWSIIPKGPDEVLPIVEDILNLELHSVGVAEFDREGDIPLIIHQVPELPPAPDRQRIALATVMQQGIPGLARM